MRIVVTGREGQVAQALAEYGAKAGHDVVRLGRPDFDLLADPDAIARALEHAQPELIVSAAAYTAVDRAEIERDLAFAVNERGAGAVARGARLCAVPLIHLSTDYVFAGDKESEYLETDPTEPATVYGASKLAGERAVLAAHEDAVILRTAWVYSAFGSNFVKTMLRLAEDRSVIDVVHDQRGNPTSAHALAEATVGIGQNLRRVSDSRLRGIFHLAGTGIASWAEFAEGIFAASATYGGPTASVRGIPSSEFSTATPRPANSTLSMNKVLEAHGLQLPQWQYSLGEVVQRSLSIDAGSGRLD